MSDERDTSGSIPPPGFGEPKAPEPEPEPAPPAFEQSAPQPPDPEPEPIAEESPAIEDETEIAVVAAEEVMPVSESSVSGEEE